MTELEKKYLKAQQYQSKEDDQKTNVFCLIEIRPKVFEQKNDRGVG